MDWKSVVVPTVNKATGAAAAAPGAEKTVSVPVSPPASASSGSKPPPSGQ